MTRHPEREGTLARGKAKDRSGKEEPVPKQTGNRGAIDPLPSKLESDANQAKSRLPSKLESDANQAKSRLPSKLESDANQANAERLSKPRAGRDSIAIKTPSRPLQRESSSSFDSPDRSVLATVVARAVTEALMEAGRTHPPASASALDTDRQRAQAREDRVLKSLVEVETDPMKIKALKEQSQEFFKEGNSFPGAKAQGPLPLPVGADALLGPVLDDKDLRKAVGEYFKPRKERIAKEVQSNRSEES